MEFNADFGPTATGDGAALKHPTVTFFHLLFRSAALFVYLFGSYLSSSFIGVFVSVVLLLSLDFWTVKNVSGRLMVGLRWWNYVNPETGASEWLFEARNGDSAHLLSPSEVRIFWTSLVLTPALWLVFLMTAVLGLRFQWLVLVVIGLALSLSNLLGYLRCRLGQTESLTSSVSKVANSYMQRQMFSRVTSMFGGGGGASTNPAASMSATPNDII